MFDCVIFVKVCDFAEIKSIQKKYMKEYNEKAPSKYIMYLDPITSVAGQ